jgi:hypothetical protein
MKVRMRCVGRPPRRIKARLRRTLKAVKIHPPLGSWIEALCQTVHRQGQHGVPPLVRFIHRRAAPQSALQIMFFSGCDIEVDPKSIWSHLKFLVAAKRRRIGLQKRLTNVAIPQLISAAAGISIGKHRNNPIPRVKAQVQTLGSPQQPHLRLALPVGVPPLPVRAEADRRRGFPRGVSRKPSASVLLVRRMAVAVSALILRVGSRHLMVP